MELEIKDQYLRRASSFPKPPLGVVLEDIISKFPGPELIRTHDTSVATQTEIFSRDPQEILCRGAAVGLDLGGLCRHVRPGLKGVLGFAAKNLDRARVAVVTQGAFEISIPGISPNSIGKTVYALGPDEFSLDDGLALGKIFYLNPERPNKVMCVFLRYDSKKKMALNLTDHSVRFI